MTTSSDEDESGEGDHDDRQRLQQQQLQNILPNVSLERAQELLEAGSGQLERAIHIHFSTTTTTTTTGTEKTDPQKQTAQPPRRPKKRRRNYENINVDEDVADDKPEITANNENKKVAASAAATPPSKNNNKKKQSTLDSFILNKKKNIGPKQSTLDLFLLNKKKRKSRNSPTTQLQQRSSSCSSDRSRRDDNEDQKVAAKISSRDEDDVIASRDTDGGDNGQKKYDCTATTDKEETSLEAESANNNNNNKKEPCTAQQQQKPPKTEVAAPPAETTSLFDDDPTRRTVPPPPSVDLPPVLSSSSTPPRPPHPDMDYQTVAQALSELTATTKRTIKLAVLQKLFVSVIRTVGGIRSSTRRPEEEKGTTATTTTDNTTAVPDDLNSRLLTFVIDLVMGKLSMLTILSHQHHRQGGGGGGGGVAITSPHPPPPPLQVSGGAVSTAVQTLTGATRKQLSVAYRQTGDLGDCAARFFADRQQNSVSRFFVAAPADSQCKGKQDSSSKSRSLSVTSVHEMLQAIATVPAGTGSQARRQQLLIKLLRSCRHKEEIRFLVRTLLNNMRLGATIKTILVALANAAAEMQQQQQQQPPNTLNVVSGGDSAKVLEATFHVCPRVPEIAHALLQGGVAYAAKHCSLTVGYPIQPMLANPASSLDDVRKFLSGSNLSSGEKYTLPCLLEWKYDGIRCQAHWDGTKMKLFSRHLLETTEQFPDVVESLLEAKIDSVESFVIDSEIAGVTKSNTGELHLLPFQDLSTRRSVNQQQNDVQVCVFCFDIMYLNGRSLLKEPQWKRQEIFRANFAETTSFRYTSTISLPLFDEATVRSALKEAVKGGAEGLMIKLTGAPTAKKDTPEENNKPVSRTFGYESGMRGKLWLKLKRDYVQGFADTIDVVPVGAWLGSGRKASKNFLSPVLLAVYNDEDGTFQSISRCMSFSDAMYNAMRDFYFHNTPYPPGVGIVEDAADEADAKDDDNQSDDEQSSLPVEEIQVIDWNPLVDSSDDAVLDRVNCLLSRPPSVVTHENPTIWFKPVEVFEMSFADLSISKVHTAAADFVQDGSGIALRFPRFKRRRPDKSVEQATTAAQIAEMYRRQTKIR